MDFLASVLYEALKNVAADHGCKWGSKCQSCTAAAIALRAAEVESHKAAPVAESTICRIPGTLVIKRDF